MEAHVKDCKINFAKQQRNNYPSRGISPKPHQRSKIDSIRNKSPQKLNESVDMALCDHCGSSFSLIALLSHVPQCKQNQAKEFNSNNRRENDYDPMTRCHICDQQVPKIRLESHIKNCKHEWLK